MKKSKIFIVTATIALYVAACGTSSNSTMETDTSTVNSNMGGSTESSTGSDTSMSTMPADTGTMGTPDSSGAGQGGDTTRP